MNRTRWFHFLFSLFFSMTIHGSFVVSSFFISTTKPKILDPPFQAVTLLTLNPTPSISVLPKPKINEELPNPPALVQKEILPIVSKLEEKVSKQSRVEGTTNQKVHKPNRGPNLVPTQTSTSIPTPLAPPFSSPALDDVEQKNDSAQIERKENIKSIATESDNSSGNCTESKPVASNSLRSESRIRTISEEKKLQKYLGEIQALIHKNVRSVCRKRHIAQQGICLVQFDLQESGKIREIRIRNRNGNKELENLSLECIQKTSPVSPCPVHLTEGHILIQIPIKYQ